MAESQHAYQTVLNITGNISPELLASMKALVGHNAKVIKQSVEMGKESKKGFELMTRGTELAREKMVELSDTIKEMLLPLLDITAAFKVFTTVGDTLEHSIDSFKEIREQATALRGIIAGTDYVTKHGGSPELLMQQYLGVSKELAEQQGGVFTEAFYTGIQSTMAEVGLGPGLTKELTKNLVNFAAMKKGSLNVTEGDVKGSFAVFCG